MSIFALPSYYNDLKIMEENKITPLKNAMNYGTVVGFVLIIISVLFYILGKSDSDIQAWIAYAVIIAGIVIGTQNYRDNQLGGYINYTQCLASGTLIAFFTAIITAFYTYLFFTFIDASLIETLLEKQMITMEEKGLDDEQIEMAMLWTRKFMTPMWMSVMVLLSYTFMGFVFSLITSIFLKKKNDSFENNFQ